MGVEKLDWPAQSTDLNPIEHLSDKLECQMQTRAQCTRSIPDLLKILQEQWKSIPVASYQNLEDQGRIYGGERMGPNPLQKTK